MFNILILTLAITAVIFAVVSYTLSKVRIQEFIRTVTVYKTREEQENFITSVDWYRRNQNKITIDQLVGQDLKAQRINQKMDMQYCRIKELEKDLKEAESNSELFRSAFNTILKETKGKDALKGFCYDYDAYEKLVREYAVKNPSFRAYLVK